MGPTGPRIHTHRGEDWQGLATDPSSVPWMLLLFSPKKCAVITLLPGAGQVPCSRQKKK